LFIGAVFATQKKAILAFAHNFAHKIKGETRT
jgi:hypothetical protein